MGMLEDRFRRRFEPHPGGFRFVQWGSGVIFSAEEVEDFVSIWRRSWANPRNWAAYAAAGIGLPLYLLWREEPGLAAAVAVVAAIAMVVLLYHAHREPNAVAEKLLRTQAPGKVREAPWFQRLLWVLLMAATGGILTFDGGDGWRRGAGIAMLAGLAIIAVQEARALLRRRRS